MKTRHSLRKIVVIALLAFFQNSFIKAQISPCPYMIINGLKCDITVFVEFRDSNCGTLCPWANPITLNPGGTILAGDAACCATGIYDMIFFLVDIDGQPLPWPFVEISAGMPTCAGGGLSNSGPMPPVTCPASAFWNMNISPAAGTVLIN